MSINSITTPQDHQRRARPSGGQTSLKPYVDLVMVTFSTSVHHFLSSMEHKRRCLEECSHGCMQWNRLSSFRKVLQVYIQSRLVRKHQARLEIKQQITRYLLKKDSKFKIYVFELHITFPSTVFRLHSLYIKEANIFNVMHIGQSYINEAGQISVIVLINWMRFNYTIIYLSSINLISVSYIWTNWTLLVPQLVIF